MAAPLPVSYEMVRTTVRCGDHSIGVGFDPFDRVIEIEGSAGLPADQLAADVRVVAMRYVSEEMFRRTTRYGLPRLCR